MKVDEQHKMLYEIPSLTLVHQFQPKRHDRYLKKQNPGEGAHPKLRNGSRIVRGTQALAYKQAIEPGLHLVVLQQRIGRHAQQIAVGKLVGFRHDKVVTAFHNAQAVFFPKIQVAHRCAHECVQGLPCSRRAQSFRYGIPVLLQAFRHFHLALDDLRPLYFQQAEHVQVRAILTPAAHIQEEKKHTYQEKLDRVRITLDLSLKIGGRHFARYQQVPYHPQKLALQVESCVPEPQQQVGHFYLARYLLLTAFWTKNGLSRNFLVTIRANDLLAGRLFG